MLSRGHLDGQRCGRSIWSAVWFLFRYSSWCLARLDRRPIRESIRRLDWLLVSLAAAALRWNSIRCCWETYPTIINYMSPPTYINPATSALSHEAYLLSKTSLGLLVYQSSCLRAVISCFISRRRKFCMMHTSIAACQMLPRHFITGSSFYYSLRWQSCP